MSGARTVEFFEISAKRGVLDEIASDLSDRQMAAFVKAIGRLEKYGWELDGTFFDNVAGSKLKLREFRLTLDRVDYRVLFSEEPTKIFLMLRGYKERRNGISKATIDAAEARLRVWRDRRAQMPRATKNT